MPMRRSQSYHWSIIGEVWHEKCFCDECSSVHLSHADKEKRMLWTIFVILLVMWLLGLVTSYTMGGFIHILLVIAIVVALIQIISGRRAI